jgi:hypothetical protein
MLEFLQCYEQISNRAASAIKPPHQHHIDLAGKRASKFLAGLPLQDASNHCAAVADTTVDCERFARAGTSMPENLGLHIQSSEARIGNIAGGRVGLRTAVADRLRVANLELHHVAFMVLRDDQPPFTKLPVDHRGVLGISVLLAFHTMTLHDGMPEFELSRSRGGMSDPNLAFDESTPIVKAKVLERELAFLLDTEAQETFLYQPFVDAFPTLFRQPEGPESKKVTGVGQKPGDQSYHIVGSRDPHRSIRGKSALPESPYDENHAWKRVVRGQHRNGRSGPGAAHHVRLSVHAAHP